MPCACPIYENNYAQLDCLSTGLGDLRTNNILDLFLGSIDANDLKSLNLPRNKLSKIPAKMSMFPRLENVDLKFNNINSIPTGAFNFTATLRHLDLQHNNIEQIEPAAFQGDFTSIHDRFYIKSTLFSIQVIMETVRQSI